MHDIYRPRHTPATPRYGCIGTRAGVERPSRTVPSYLEEFEVVRFGEPGPDGQVREIVSSGPDWHGRQGRRPEPKLTADRQRVEVPRVVRKVQQRLRTEGRHAEADHLDTRLRLWQRAQWEPAR